MRNIYGLPPWKFKLMQNEFNALPEDSPTKKRIREREIELCKNLSKAFEKRALDLGFKKVGEGQFEKHSDKHD